MKPITDIDFESEDEGELGRQEFEDWCVMVEPQWYANPEGTFLTLGVSRKLLAPVMSLRYLRSK